MSQTTNLLLLKADTGQAQKEITYNGDLDSLDAAVAGQLSLATVGGTTTLTTQQASNAVFNVSGTLTSNAILELPSSASAGRVRVVFVNNNTSGNFTLTVRYQGGSGVVVPQGYGQLVWHDGVNAYAATRPISASTGLSLAAVPAARAFHSTTQAVANNSVTALLLDSERFDNSSIHSTSVNTSRLTAPVTGLYTLIGCAGLAALGAGTARSVLIRINGTTIVAHEQVPPVSGGSNPTLFNVSALYNLAAGDYAELCAYQDSGGTLNTWQSGNYSPEFSMHLVSL